ncbi:sensor histidine kinase [Streptomyces europaeiscabiei]|uniref:sensor histidine kinase n=1 Tax=Streptomyces europaeiscabiei TaxID=146819 RepID=UPI002E1775B4
MSALQERATSITDRTGRRPTITVEATDPFPQLPLPAETAAYRIADEALTNVVRHAQATRCVVRLSTNTGTGAVLTVEVHDNGRGPTAPCRGNGGVGLVSMRRRAEELGGTLRIAVDDTGNTVTAQLPLNTGQ